MAESPTIGVRIPPEWLEEINALCKQTGKTKTQVILEALAQYLGKNTVVGINADIETIRNVLRHHDQRLEAIEKKLNRESAED
ncbi:ribbon-helix-helix protein, CopG family [Microseira sp. BLCC-F43]|jgi:metal-responsive CopG/Arc/MetJ family transcriptional regulator|uniref:ribbon-helix-helix protein, CopG family n=1 Tax=Microseira sp. BLCC-F43 TaxID=3153602 RepID=UPI0035B9F04F